MRKLASLTILTVLSICFVLVWTTTNPFELLKIKSNQAGAESGGTPIIKEGSEYKHIWNTTPEGTTFIEECKRVDAGNNICAFKPKNEQYFTKQCCTKPCIKPTPENNFISTATICPAGALMKIKYIAVQNSVVRLRSYNINGPEWNAFVDNCKLIPGTKACGYKRRGNPYTVECCKSNNCRSIPDGEGDWFNICDQKALISVSYSI